MCIRDSFYIADILMVATDLVLTLRNRRLDRERDGVEYNKPEL